MKYVAHFKTSYQISFDEWTPYRLMLDVTEETTVKEIMDWFSKNNKGKHPLNIVINEVEVTNEK